MLTILSDIEVRVLGALVEKQVTTPEYYPLTLNALTLACNQKNNRQPITSYDETSIAATLETLREKNLVYVFYGSTSRVPKYKHVMTEVLGLSPQQLAVTCVLMLRGAQTVGELRERSSRLHEFSGIEEIEETLNSLITREPEPLVARLPRQPGQKEVRYGHLLSGEVRVESVAQPAGQSEPPRRISRTNSSDDRMLLLEQTVAVLKDEINSLQHQFEEFKKQFE